MKSLSEDLVSLMVTEEHFSQAQPTCAPSEMKPSSGPVIAQLIQGPWACGRRRRWVPLPGCSWSHSARSGQSRS